MEVIMNTAQLQASMKSPPFLSKPSKRLNWGFGSAQM